MNIRHEIEKVAYELYIQRGSSGGNDLDHWLEAEAIVLKRMAALKKEANPAEKKIAKKPAPAKKTAASATAEKKAKPKATVAPTTGTKTKSAPARAAKPATKRITKSA